MLYFKIFIQMSDLNKDILKMTFELKTMIGRVHSHLLPKDFFCVQCNIAIFVE